MPVLASDVLIRPDRGRVVALKDSPKLQRLAMRWSYIARYRRRWTTSAASEGRLEGHIRAEVARIGLNEECLRRLGAARLIEVAVPWERESVGWAPRILPWEFLLASATAPYREGPVLIVRRLVRPTRRRGPARAPAAPRNYGFVAATAGLGDAFTFEAERRLVRESLTGLRATPDAPSPLTAERVGTHLNDERPDVLHVMGADNHQAAGILGLDADPDDDGRVRDGLPFLRSRDGGPRLVPAEEAARILVDRRRPHLVAFNVYHSAARLAPLAIARGAQAALGIQDTFDDRAAELFFLDFYTTWVDTDWDLLSAFQEALERAKDRTDLTGTGLVLWTQQSLVSPQWERREPAKRIRGDQLDAAALARQLTCRIDPIVDLNYSMLHNNRDLFARFEIHKHAVDRPVDVEVEVALHVGADTYPYRATHRLTDPITSLKDVVRVPLTSSLIRTVSEKMWTTLFAEVRLGDYRLESRTHRVGLLPADEWKDNKTDGRWLPAFVLPRDPAVERIIGMAQRYLYALADRSDAGFDGYQSIACDPLAVDRQVQAIWWALVRDLGLGYVNPPPSYSAVAQRLRSPSQVLSAGRGTCIDLSLLLAACLEYVGIYPVIFLLTGHACPGYWRNEQAYAVDFLEVHDAPSVRGDDEPSAGTFGALASGPRDGYILSSDAFDEVREHIRAGSLIPLEAVWLTNHSGFDAAQAAGCDNLRRKRDFDMMLDVGLARTPACDITPLPFATRAAARNEGGGAS